MDLFVKRAADFSHDRRYRYRLEIRWDEGPVANWLMLNPSTADEVQNDPTIERCERRSRNLGYGGLVVTNLFAFKGTDPDEMKVADDPVGPDNDQHIMRAAREAGWHCYRCLGFTRQLQRPGGSCDQDAGRRRNQTTLHCTVQKRRPWSSTVCRVLGEADGVLMPDKRLGKITEKAFMAQVVQLAKYCGWKIYHTFNSRRSSAGFPDLLLIRGHDMLVAELKRSPKERLTTEQMDWIVAFERAAVAAYVWTPESWPEIEKTLARP